MVTRRKKERGAALLESAITIPIILLVSVGIFEFGRAFQTWQVLTNAAREGARVSIIAGKTNEDVEEAVRKYLEVGGVEGPRSTSVVITRGTETIGTNDFSKIQISYPFKFIVLSGVMKLVNKNSTRTNDLTMGAVAIMRNEN